MVINLNEQYLYFNCPPSPFYLESGQAHYKVGDAHPNRYNLQLFDMIVVNKGCLYIGEAEDEWAVEEGEVIILLPNSYHYNVKPVEKETSFYWVHFQTVNHWVQSDQHALSSHLEKHQQCFNPMPYTMKIAKHFKLSYPQQTYQLFERMNTTQQLLEPKAYWEKQQSFAALLHLCDVRQHQTHTNQLVKLAERVEQYLRMHYKQSISNEHLVHIFNYHYNYITRAMKAVYQLSPHDYMTKLRMDEAKVLLLHSFATVSAIAHEVGYDNAPYFTNCFRKQVGMTPSQFRKLYGHQ